jgi:hypothetical protein
MCKRLRITVVGTVYVAALLLSIPAHAGNGSAVGAGLVGFGVGAILGSALTPQTVVVAPPPPPPVYVAPPPPPVYYAAPPPPVYYGGVVYGPRYRHR